MTSLSGVLLACRLLSTPRGPARACVGGAGAASPLPGTSTHADRILLSSAAAPGAQQPLP